MNHPYEGDVTAEACWNALRNDPDSFLVDVRTSAEWNFVGFPEMPEGHRTPIFAEWQSYPAMSVDPSGFAAKVSGAIEAAGGSRQSRIFFLCRSGARSMSSAATMTGAGFEHCFNIADGFEGPPDDEGHRGRVAGWKAAGLPWRQK
jgi:rhodanese-related sulfurtransferase